LGVIEEIYCNSAVVFYAAHIFICRLECPDVSVLRRCKLVATVESVVKVWWADCPTATQWCFFRRSLVRRL